MCDAQGAKKTGKYPRPRQMSRGWSDRPNIFRLTREIEGWLDDIVNVSFQGENNTS